MYTWLEIHPGRWHQVKTQIFASTAAQSRHTSIRCELTGGAVCDNWPRGHPGSCTSQVVPVTKLLQSLSLSLRCTTCKNRDINSMHPLEVLGRLRITHTRRLAHRRRSEVQPPASTTCAPLLPAKGGNRVLETGNQSKCQNQRSRSEQSNYCNRPSPNLTLLITAS